MVSLSSQLEQGIFHEESLTTGGFADGCSRLPPAQGNMEGAGEGRRGVRQGDLRSQLGARGLVMVLGRVGLLREAEAGWDQSQGPCKAGVQDHR